MPEGACFLKVLLHLPATYLTSLFYLFDSSFSLKKEIFLVRTLHLFTWILKAKYSLIYDSYDSSFNLRHSFLVSGRLAVED